MTGRGFAQLLIAVIVGVSAALVGLAGNAAAGEHHWPGPLDLVRTHPWPAVGILVAVGVAVEVLLWALNRNQSPTDAPPPAQTSIRVEPDGIVVVNRRSAAGPPGDSPLHTSSDASTVYAGSGRGSQLWNVPPRVTLFTGRDDLLAVLHTRLGTDGSVVIRTLHGWGGVGKTTLAIEYAYRYIDDYRIVWWIDAEQPALVGEQMAALAVEAGWVSADTAMGKAVAAARDHLRAGAGWLVVFDNAATPSDVRDWLPDGPGQVIVTSRHPNWEQVATASMEVDVFTRGESVALLRRLAPDLDVRVAQEICNVLGDLPLGITQAGSVLAETGIAGPVYLARLREHAGQAMGHGHAAGYPRSLAAAVRITADQVAREDQAAAQLLQVCTMLAPEPVPLDLLFATAPDDLLPQPLRTVATDSFEWGQRVARLARYGLVKPTPDGPIMHRLTQATIADQIGPDVHAQTRALAEGLLTAAQPANARDPVWWPMWARLLPHLLVCDPASSDNPDLRWMATEAAFYLLDRGDLTAGHALAHDLYQAWQRRLGENHPDTLTAAFMLADAYQRRGEFDRAVQLDQDTLNRRRRIFGDDDTATLRSANSLAGGLRDVGRMQEALDLDKDTLARRRRVYGDDDRRTLTSASNLAIDLRAVGWVQEALALDTDTLDRRRRVLGDDHPDTLISAANLAAGLRALGRVQEALALDDDNLSRYRRVLGDDHPSTLTAASNLAIDLRAVGRVRESLVLDKDTLTRRRRILGDNHPDTLSSAANFANDLRTLGRVNEAKALEAQTRNHSSKR